MTTIRRTNYVLRDRLLIVTTALFGVIAIVCAIGGTIMLFSDGS